MTSRLIINLLSYADVCCCMVALAVMIYHRQHSKFRAVVLYLVTKVTAFAILHPVRSMGGHQLSKILAYKIYFYTYWVTYGIDAVLGFFIILSIYRLAMAPLPGLQRLGMLMFKWAAGIAAVIACSLALSPHASSTFFERAITEFQQTQSVLTLCMLLFVCLAIRPMGISVGSKIFGVSLGLGIMATTQLVDAAWFSHIAKMYSIYNVVSGAVVCIATLVWIAYFSLPEPKRRMIVLPTTSPFLRWNQISLALGDAPGFVALGEVTPEMFAPAEVEIMRRASLKMRPQLASEPNPQLIAGN